MATLLDRLTGHNLLLDQPGDEKIAFDTFLAGLVELSAGEVTKPALVAYFNLDAGQETNLDWLIAQYQARATDDDKREFVRRVGYLMHLAESRVPGYTDMNALQTRIANI